jgi:replicative DNA helicase
MVVGRGELLEQVIARCVRRFKALAREADCPVLLLSQMNRNSEKRAESSYMPQLSDLRDSGTIEQVADGVIFIYRPNKYGLANANGQSQDNSLKLILAKNRNGATGHITLAHNETFTRFC